MNIEQVVAEMPKAKNPYPDCIEIEDVVYAGLLGFNQGVEAQCQLLAEQGYGKLRTQYEILDWLRRCYAGLEEICSLDLLAQELHRWLLEGE